MSTTVRHPIRRLLFERGVSVTEFARLIAYGYTHTWQVLTGRAKPSHRFQAACARVLNLPEAELFGEGGNGDTDIPTS